jgi:hypothetical protein
MTREKILSQIIKGDFEIINKEEFFSKSLMNSEHLEYLTIYTREELSKFELYKIKNQNIGFAITSDKEIISVHNNTGFHKLGSALISKAINLGGEKVFHYDGWLTGFYAKLNFVEDVNKRIEWDEKFAPASWKYLPINIFNVNNSVYAQEIIEKIHPLKVIEFAKRRYTQGKPDLISRTIKR